jgi:hypothetical protein
LEAVPYHIAKGSALFFRRFGIRIYIMLRVCLLPLFVIAFTSAVFAETTIVLNPNEKPMASATPTPQVRVSVNVNAFVPAPAEDREQGFKAQEQGRRMIYDLADYECAVLRVYRQINSPVSRRPRASMSTAISAFASCQSDRA